MPPLVRAPGSAPDQGQRVDERLRVPVVLGDAGRDGEDVRVEHDVLGGEPGLPREQVVGAAADLHLALGGVGLAGLVEGHDDDAAPKSRMRRACSRNGPSPSLRLIELTTPLPWTVFSPASRTLHRELSTMIGMRATSGSVAIRLRNVVISRSLSSRSASMLTSRRFAPPRTCSSATSTAAWWSPARSACGTAWSR